MELMLTPAEIACIKVLANQYENGNEACSISEGSWNELGLTEKNYISVLSSLESYGAIGDCEFVRGQGLCDFVIRPHILQLSRKITEAESKQAEKKDMVESIKYTVHRHPVLAWGLIAFFALTGLFTFLNQLTGTLKNLNVIK